MSEEPLKFRCYGCNQLLGVSPRKSGSTIACPRCKAELLVPPPAESATSSDSAKDSGPGEALPGDLLAIRPEDLRVEESFAGIQIDPVKPVTGPLNPEGAKPAPREGDSRDSPGAARIVTLAIPEARPSPDAIMMEVAIDEPAVVPRRPEAAPVHEVVLHPATVMAWSLFVLMALPLAFVAGLMIGHFLWK